MEPMKNLFNILIVEKISLALKRSYSAFDVTSFLKGIDSSLAPLELKERVAFLADRIYLYLPDDPKISLPILLNSLKKNEDDKIGLSHFAIWPLTHFIGTYGLNDFDLSMNCLKEMTKLFTSEFAIRSFFVLDQKRTLNYLKKWLEDDNEHVRRLVSEGSRPLLPWGQKLHSVASDPLLTWALLEKLKNDPSEYVRKSVANHINDHSKNHPDFVILKLSKWHLLKNKTSELTWLIKYASRTLIKKGFSEAFIFHGVDNVKIKVLEQKIVTLNVRLGDRLSVTVMLENKSKSRAKIIIDNEIHLLKANAKHSIKVFKGKKINLAPKAVTKIEMSIPLKLVTTRVYYSGKHFWNVKVNGISHPPLPFNLSTIKSKIISKSL